MKNTRTVTLLTQNAQDWLVDLQTKSQVLCLSALSTFIEMEESDPMTNNICELCFKTEKLF